MAIPVAKGSTSDWSRVDKEDVGDEVERKAGKPQGLAG